MLSKIGMYAKTRYNSRGKKINSIDELNVYLTRAEKGGYVKIWCVGRKFDASIEKSGWNMCGLNWEDDITHEDAVRIITDEFGQIQKHCKSINYKI